MKEKMFQRKEQVIGAALQEFITNDYEKASLNHIIKLSGISKGTFYYHFYNKEALYLYLLKTGSDLKWQYIEEQIKTRAIDFDKMDIFDKFLYQAEISIGFSALYPHYHALGLMFSKEKSHPIYQIALAYLGGSSMELIGSMVQESFLKQEFKSEFDQVFLNKVLSYLLIHFDQIFDNTDLKSNLENLTQYVNFMKYGCKRE